MCFIAIDLKSFYASVEAIERGLDPLKTHLVVADVSRTDKTICLAVSPSLKAYGIPGRARLFEVVQRVKEINAERLSNAPKKELNGATYFSSESKADVPVPFESSPIVSITRPASAPPSAVPSSPIPTRTEE